MSRGTRGGSPRSRTRACGRHPSVSTPDGPPPRLVLLNKPYGVLCQFTGPPGRDTLADFVSVPGVYPAGRLDADSEGLVVLTDSGWVQHRIADPRHSFPKTYWVQVEGTPGSKILERLGRGVLLRDGPTLPAEVRPIAEPDLWPRVPPVRYRKSVPTTWLEVVLREGRNRQVRRMTAAVGFGTLRLVRVAVGPWRLGGLSPGEWVESQVPHGWHPPHGGPP